MLAALGRQGWLDRPGYRLEHGVGLALATCGGAGERISNVLYGVRLGHPLHPLVTAVPMGAVTTAVALDAASLLPHHSPDLREVSRFALAVGIVGSLGAAVTGLHDWQQTQERTRRVGLVHGALNSIATGLYIASWFDRRRGRHRRGMAGSALGYASPLPAAISGPLWCTASGPGWTTPVPVCRSGSGRRCWR